MKFLLQVRFNGADKVIGALPAGEQQKVTDEFIAIRQSPGVLDGNQLQAASEAATVRVRDGQPQVTTGPAVEAGSELDGYYLYDAPGLEEAVAFAARIPVARLAGTVEVRRCWNARDAGFRRPALEPGITHLIAAAGRPRRFPAAVVTCAGRAAR
jgi:hypothetical protein